MRTEFDLPTIRTATRHDAAQLAQLAEQTFRDTYAAANTTEDMAVHVRQSYGESVQAREIDDPRMATLICEADDLMIGFAQLRWEAAPACVIADVPGEIHRLYVDGAWHGKGLGPQLMEACLGALHARGSDQAWLGVWERNPRAIAFYRKFGFVEVGAHVFPVGRDLQRDLIMVRAVAPG